ncbi:MAG: hypothetical protein WAP03_18840 [Methylorubrum rhodinum]|uniref:hypothetical protein n=1 Tax=Methylorubrum rhodinum TaxID=29428 RepID=UPI003BAEF72B
MTERELAAFRAGVRYAADMAHVLALALELRDDAGAIRQLAAIEALRGLAEGLKDEARPPAANDALHRLIAAIAADLATAGTASCPECAGQLAWIKDSSNGHIHARCEDAGCLAVMQ